jgi:hypothetical protein
MIRNLHFMDLIILSKTMYFFYLLVLKKPLFAWALVFHKLFYRLKFQFFAETKTQNFFLFLATFQYIHYIIYFESLACNKIK